MDQSKFKLVLYNIFSNAIKYSEKGAIGLKIKMMTLEETVNKIEEYSQGMTASEQEGSLMEFKKEIMSLYGNIHADIRTSLSSYDSFSYHRRFINVTIKDQGSGMTMAQ